MWSVHQLDLNENDTKKWFSIVRSTSKCTTIAGSHLV
jgi:hypothetical protein